MKVKQIFTTYDRHKDQVMDGFKFCPYCQAELVDREVGGKMRPVCPDCGFTHFRNPAPAVVVMVVDDDQVLLGIRGGEPGKGKWALPSGYIEYEDDFLSTGIREVHEETGLDVEIDAIINVDSAFLSPEYHFLTIYLLAHVVGGELRAGDDLQVVGWYSMKHALPDLVFRQDYELIQCYAAGELDSLPVEKVEVP